MNLDNDLFARLLKHRKPILLYGCDQDKVAAIVRKFGTEIAYLDLDRASDNRMLAFLTEFITRSDGLVSVISASSPGQTKRIPFGLTNKFIIVEGSN